MGGRAAAAAAGDAEPEDEEPPASPKSATADLHRKIVVQPLASATPRRLRTLLRTRLASGLLIVLPRDLTTLPVASLARLRLLEHFLATRSWESAAIYFAFDDEYLEGMVANLRAVAAGQAEADRYQLQVNTPDATQITGTTVNNFHVSLSTTQRVSQPCAGEPWPLPQFPPVISLPVNVFCISRLDSLIISARSVSDHAL